MSTKHYSEDTHILHLAEYFGFDPPDPKPTPTTAYVQKPLPGASLRLCNQLMRKRRWPSEYPLTFTNPIP